MPKTNWLLLRGLGREAEHWGEFAKVFNEKLSNSVCHTLDLPGTGAFAGMSAPLSIGKTVEVARKEFLKLSSNNEGPWIILAVSLGGMVAAEWNSKYPKDFSAMVLVNTSFRAWSPVWKRLWYEAYIHFGRILTEKDLLERERHVLAMVSNKPELYDKIAAEWSEIAKKRPLSFPNFIRQLWAASRFEPPSVTPSLPVLVLNSAKDRMVHPSCSKVIAERWGCDIDVHSSAGHDLVLDDPEWVAERIQEWLARFKPEFKKK